jgi:hypothetical protein
LFVTIDPGFGFNTVEIIVGVISGVEIAIGRLSVIANIIVLVEAIAKTVMFFS